MLIELTDKNADIVRLAEQACRDPSVLAEIAGGLRLKVNTKSPEETIRYNCYKVLMHVAATKSEMLYPEWSSFVQLLSSNNSYHKMAAVQLIAALVKPETEDRFEKIFDEYFGLLDDQSVIVSIYVASNAGKMVTAVPALEPRITEKLLGIEKTHHPAGRKALIAAGAVESFGAYIAQSSDRERIIEFVTSQQQSQSPKTRKLAKEFIKRWAGG